MNAERQCRLHRLLQRFHAVRIVLRLGPALLLALLDGGPITIGEQYEDGDTSACLANADGGIPAESIDVALLDPHLPKAREIDKFTLLRYQYLHVLRDVVAHVGIREVGAVNRQQALSKQGIGC